MSSGIGCAMISLKNFSPSAILLSHNEGAFGWRALHQKSVRSAISELTLVFRCASFIDKRNRAPKEPLHLVLQPRPIASGAAAAILHAELAHELVQRPAKHQFAALSPHGFRAHPRQEQARDVAEWQLVFHPGDHSQLVRPVLSDILFPVPWIGAWQTTQREQPSHEAEIGVRFARANKLIDLVETGEVVPRLGRGGHQGSTAGQFNAAGSGADGHEPTDWSNWFTHRSKK